MCVFVGGWADVCTMRACVFEKEAGGVGEGGVSWLQLSGPSHSNDSENISHRVQVLHTAFSEVLGMLFRELAERPLGAHSFSW